MYLAASVFSLLICLVSWSRQDSTRAYPSLDQGPTTSILNHSSYVSGFADQQWYLDNIPFVDFPDSNIQDVYYYRTSVIKRHLKYFHQGHGKLDIPVEHTCLLILSDRLGLHRVHSASFLGRVCYQLKTRRLVLTSTQASKGQTIPDSAGHHILEGRWLRDPRYVQDLIQLYTRAGCERITRITYTQYVHRAIYEYAQATGDTNFLKSQLQGMIDMFYLWNVTQDLTTGLYHRTPLLDAQEFSLPGYVVGGPNMNPVTQWNAMNNNYSIIDNGPETYRVSFNAFMVCSTTSSFKTAIFSYRAFQLPAFEAY